MKISTTLRGRMQQLLASLHPPSPPTTQEGQRLLNVLRGSFQKQLDEKHPNPLESRLDLQDRNEVPIARESAASHATANYFRAVLSHPALGFTDLPKVEHDAIRSFERLLSEDKLTPTTLVHLMKRHMLARGNAKTRNDASFGDRLNTWIQSTDRFTRENFFLDRYFLKAAAALLVSEKNEAVLWKWLRLVYERELVIADLTDRRWLAVEDRLVSSLIRLAIHRRDLEDAAQQFLQACRYRIDSGRGNPSFSAIKLNTTPSSSSMTLSATVLASAIVYHRHQHGIPAEVFSNLPQFLLDWSSRTGPELSHAFCQIYDPAQPSASHLYNYLKEDAQAQILIDRQAKASATSRTSVMTAVLDASKVALDQGYRMEAAFLLDFAIDNYPDYLPPRETHKVEEQLPMSLNFAPG